MPNEDNTVPVGDKIGRVHYSADIIEAESAAALDKSSDDDEEEDSFFYTKSTDLLNPNVNWLFNCPNL